MRLSGSDRVLLAAFGLLVVGSIAIKAMAGPPRDGWANLSRAQVSGELRGRLAAQGFATFVIPLKIQSPVVIGQRGKCRLSVRDARDGKALMTQFASDAAAIGRVRYLYKGDSYSVPPALRIRLGRLQTEILGRMTGHPRAHIPVAMASSPECGSADYGMGEFSISV